MAKRENNKPHCNALTPTTAQQITLADESTNPNTQQLKEATLWTHKHCGPFVCLPSVVADGVAGVDEGGQWATDIRIARASGCAPELLCPLATLWLTLRISQPPTPTPTITSKTTPVYIHPRIHLPCSEKFAIICTTQQQTVAASSLSDPQLAPCFWLLALTTTHSPQHATDYSGSVKYIKSSIVYCRLMCEDVCASFGSAKRGGRCWWLCGKRVCVWHGVYPSFLLQALLVWSTTTANTFTLRIAITTKL